jgi:hypothetical protein
MADYHYTENPNLGENGSSLSQRAVSRLPNLGHHGARLATPEDWSH